MESGILAIRFLKASYTNDFTSLADFGNEDPQVIRKAWQLANVLLNETEVEQFKRVLEHSGLTSIQKKKEEATTFIKIKDINSFKQILKT